MQVALQSFDFFTQRFWIWVCVGYVIFLVGLPFCFELTVSLSYDVPHPNVRTAYSFCDLQFIILTGLSAVALRLINPPRAKVTAGVAAAVSYVDI
jgi:hypothetical protein